MSKPSSQTLWMPWYIRDYLVKTMHLTTEQHGALLLLLGAYWTNKGPLPDDDTYLSGQTRLPLKAWQKHKPILMTFFTVEAGFWKQARADRELARTSAVSERRRLGGRKTASRRWATPELPVSNPESGSSAVAQLPVSNQLSGRQSQSQSQSHKNTPSLPQSGPPESGASNEPVSGPVEDVEKAASPSGEDPSPSDREKLDELQRIAAIWALYPKKVGTLEAQLEIRHAMRRDGFEVVLAGTKAIAEADGRRNGTASVGRFLPRPAEFFREGRYLDDPAQYGPRVATMDPGTLRQSIDDLAKRVAEHPGNPDNTIGSLERKKAGAAEFRELKALLAQRRQELGAVNVEVEP